MTPLSVERFDLSTGDDQDAAPIVLLHGFTGAAGTWRAFAQELNDALRRLGFAQRTILAPDLVGHGVSPAPSDERAYSIPAQIESLVVSLNRQGIHRAIWLGYSMGGRIALTLAARHPEHVDGLVLIGASAGIADASERAKRRAADEALAEMIVTHGLEAFVDRWMAHPLFASQNALGEDHIERMRTQRLRNRPEALALSLRAAGTGVMDPLHDHLSSIIAPSLIVSGELDVKFADIASTLVASMPHARKALMPGAGHAVHLEAPVLLAQEVAAFVGGLEGG